MPDRRRMPRLRLDMHQRSPNHLGTAWCTRRDRRSKEGRGEPAISHRVQSELGELFVFCANKVTHRFELPLMQQCTPIQAAITVAITVGARQQNPTKPHIRTSTEFVATLTAKQF
jgi:hypothetical protein